MILSGYLGSPEIAAVVAELRRAHQGSQPHPALLLRSRARGSRPRLFVQADIPPLVRDRLCRWLISSRQSFRVRMVVRDEGHDNSQVIAQAQALLARGPSTIVVTSAELADTPDGEIETLAIERSRAWRVRTPKLPISPSGTGDLFAALLVAARVRGSNTPMALGHAAFRHLACWSARGARTEEMRIVESAEMLVHSEAPVRCRRHPRVNGMRDYDRPRAVTPDRHCGQNLRGTTDAAPKSLSKFVPRTCQRCVRPCQSIRHCVTHPSSRSSQTTVDQCRFPALPATSGPHAWERSCPGAARVMPAFANAAALGSTTFIPRLAAAASSDSRCKADWSPSDVIM